MKNNKIREIRIIRENPRFRRYPDYKKSGVEWIGEIPRDWNTVRCAHLFEVKHIKNTSGEINLSVYRDYGVIKRDSRNDNYNRISEDTSNYKLVEPGDFVFNKMKCWQGSLGISEHRGIVSPAYTVCKPKRSFHGKYFHYLLRSWSYIQEFNRLSYGVRTGQWELRFEDFKNIIVPYPSMPEQAQIASFLDHKTEQIDELLRIKERRIKLLQEQRTALINQAVTKGLDPNMGMKPSGVEWIGEIPAHWKMDKIKYIATFISEKSTPETDAIKISPENVESKTGKVLDFYSSYDAVGVKFQDGDVLFNKIRVYLNKVVFAKYDGYSLGEMIVIRPTLQSMGKYLFYLMLSSRFIEYCDSISYGAKMPRTAVDDILNAKIPIPLDQEKFQIANFLDRKTGQIDELIAAEQQKIELLKEYRQSLISEAVTGKIDVRNEV